MLLPCCLSVLLFRLLSLLDYPLVMSNLQHMSSSTATPHKMAALVMVSCSAWDRRCGLITRIYVQSALVRTHCSCSALLSWNPRNLPPQDIDMSEVEPPVSLPMVGISCFAYLLFVEGVESSYLPLVYSTCYLFHTGLRHTRNLMEKLVFPFLR